MDFLEHGTDVAHVVLCGQTLAQRHPRPRYELYERDAVVFGNAVEDQKHRRLAVHILAAKNHQKLPDNLPQHHRRLHEQKFAERRDEGGGTDVLFRVPRDFVENKLFKPPDVLLDVPRHELRESCNQSSRCLGHVRGGARDKQRRKRLREPGAFHPPRDLDVRVIVGAKGVEERNPAAVVRAEPAFELLLLCVLGYFQPC